MQMETFMKGTSRKTTSTGMVRRRFIRYIHSYFVIKANSAMLMEEPMKENLRMANIMGKVKQQREFLNNY